jgi:hypothetical protein
VSNNFFCNKKNFGPKKHFCKKNICSGKFYWLKTLFWATIFVGQQIFVSPNFVKVCLQNLSQQNICSQTILLLNFPPVFISETQQQQNFKKQNSNLLQGITIDTY